MKEILFVSVLEFYPRHIDFRAKASAVYFAKSLSPPLPPSPAPLARPSRVGNQYEYAREARPSLNCSLARENPGHARVAREAYPLREIASVISAFRSHGGSNRGRYSPSPLHPLLQYISQKGGRSRCTRNSRDVTRTGVVTLSVTVSNSSSAVSDLGRRIAGREREHRERTVSRWQRGGP